MKKLILLLQRNTWFVEHEQSLYRIEHDDCINLALASLALAVVDEHEQVEQPHHAGSALVERAGAKAVRIRLNEPGGAMVEEDMVYYDNRCLVSLDWTTRPFKDGWIDAEARLELTGAKRAELRAYLPQVKGSNGKLLRVTNEDTGKSIEFMLPRGQSSVVPLQASGGRGRVALRIQCDPERIENSTDSRQLGFVLLGETVAAI